MVALALCCAAIWMAMLLGIACMKRYAPEQLHWYVWYALIVSVIATVVNLLIVRSAK